MTGGFRRLAETQRAPVAFRIDGRAASALAGDTVLSALRVNRATLRESEFGDGRRAGFCLMGACQDCWVWTRDGDRFRACETTIAPGMDIVIHVGEAAWPGA